MYVHVLNCVVWSSLQRLQLERSRTRLRMSLDTGVRALWSSGDACMGQYSMHPHHIHVSWYCMHPHHMSVRTWASTVCTHTTCQWYCMHPHHVSVRTHSTVSVCISASCVGTNTQSWMVSFIALTSSPAPIADTRGGSSAQGEAALPVPLLQAIGVWTRYGWL